MRSFIYITLFAATACLLSADDAPNLLKKWWLYGTSNATVTQEDGIIACECKTATDVAGVNQLVIIDQTNARVLVFSAESKAENVTGDKDGISYGIYVDATYSDGTKIYSIVAPFNTGTHDWESSSVTFTPTKPVRSVQFYLLFRKKTGKVWYRNASLVQH